MEEQRIPRLHEMVQLDYRHFHSDPDGLNYDLSWCLVRVLDLSRDSQVESELPLLITRLHSNVEPWDVFKSLYPVDKVEALWLAEIRRLAKNADEDH